MRWLLGAVAVAAAATLFAVLSPLVAALTAGALLYLLTFALKGHRFFFVQFSAAAGALMAVPVLRLTSESNELRIAVPAIVVVTALATVARFRPRFPRALTVCLILFFALDAAATAMVPDPNEWSFYALGVAVAFAGVVFASAASKIHAWPTAARALILLTVAEAGIAMLEVAFLHEPLWRGGRILADGTSTWIRNELVASIPRAQGTFGHPLPLAFCLIIGAVLLVRTRLWSVPVRAVFFLVLAGGVFVSGSRNAIVLFAALSALAYILPSLLPRLNIVATAAAAGALLAFPFLLDKYDELIGSGSVDHRLGALSAVPNLLSGTRKLSAVVIGDGSAASPRLYSAGMLQTDGFAAVDNQYVLTLAQNGLVGLLILVAVLAIAFRRASGTLRILLLGIIVSGMIFDLFAWPVAGFLVWFIVAAAWARMPGTTPPSKPVKTPSAAVLPGSSYLVRSAQ